MKQEEKKEITEILENEFNIYYFSNDYKMNVIYKKLEILINQLK